MSNINATSSKAIILGLSDTGERLPAAAGRISTQEGTATEIYARSLDAEKNANLISKVTKSGHTSTLEHTYFNIAFEDVSVFAEQFIIEFRLASFTVKSRRYVDFSDCGYYVPDFRDEKTRTAYTAHMDRLFADYKYLTDNGIPKEDARFVLPYCLHSNFFCSLNARELIHMLNAMLFGRGSAFPELKALGESLYKQASELTPGIFIGFYERKPILRDTLSFSFSSGDDTPSENKVELISYAPDAEKSVCAAVLTEYGFSSAAVSQINSDPMKRSEIIEKLICCNRPRALEFINYSFRLNGVSLSTLTHFTRHRLQSICIPSLVLTDRKKHIIPPTVAENKELLAVYSAAFNDTAKLYTSLTESGISDFDAVYCQLSGNTTDIALTMNARELLLFIKLRTCTRAQWEIRDFASDMLALCREKAPAIFDFYGPSCFVSACPEGRFSCGRSAEMKQTFAPENH